MVRADIAISIKNAVERGYSIEQAKQSLMNSGYSMKEVDEAINYLTSGVGEIELPNQDSYLPEQISREKSQQNTQQSNFQNQGQDKLAQKQQPVPVQQINYQNNNQQIIPQEQFKIPKQKRSFPWKVVILIFLLLVLVAILVGMILFKDTLIEALQNLLTG